MDGTWTIGELAELASGMLAADPPGQVSGRVREVPNDRLIRWYVTVGLVDPPLSRTGRIARYGRRHLLQLVAVKRRQAEGASLAEIQAELVGATDAYLQSAARLPADVTVPQDDDRSAADGFWRRRPALQPGVLTEPAGRAEPARRTESAELMHGVWLAPGVLLLLDAEGSGLRPAAAADLRSAAAPLLRALARHGYTAGSDDQERNPQ